MGQNADDKSPAEIEANQLKLATELRRMYMSGEVTDAQADQIRKAGIAGSGWDQPNRGRMDDLMGGVGGDRERAVDIMEEWQRGNTNPDGSPALSLGGPSAPEGNTPAGPFVPSPEFNPEEQPRVPLPGGAPRPPRPGGGGGISQGTPGSRGGVEAIENVQGPAMGEGFGFESSQNKDFYQQQFQAMLAKQMRGGIREGVARDRAAEARNAPAPEESGEDPWAWANLPDRTLPPGGEGAGGEGGGADPAAYEWQTNFDVKPGETLNSQIFGSLANRLTDTNRAELDFRAQNDPNWAGATGWSNIQDPTKALGRLGSSDPAGMNTEGRAAYSQLFNLMLQQPGGATGVAPEGFVAPGGGG